MYPIKLASLTERLYGQPMFELKAQASKLEKSMQVIHFEIGDPGFPTPGHVIEKTIEALYHGKTHYSNSNGEPECIEAVADYIQCHYGFRPDREQIVICTANAAIDFVCRCVADPGDEIIYPNPGFPTYFSCIAYGGFIPVAVPMVQKNNYIMTAQEIEKRITEKTKLIILNSSHNPTGSLMSADEVKAVYQLARKHGIFILSDEVYAKIVYDGVFQSPSQCDHCRENVIVLGSLSKTYAMTGWRLGYVVCPNHLAAKLSMMLQTILSCMSSFLQYGMIGALSGDQSIVGERVQILKERRDLLVEGLNSIDGMTCMLPRGAFYAFPCIEATKLDDQTYCERLLHEKGVCALPGSYFGEYGKGHIRLCYASVELEEIRKALDLIKDFHKII